jgi:hypothetical protein
MLLFVHFTPIPGALSVPFLGPLQVWTTSGLHLVQIYITTYYFIPPTPASETPLVRRRYPDLLNSGKPTHLKQNRLCNSLTFCTGLDFGKHICFVTCCWFVCYFNYFCCDCLPNVMVRDGIAFFL